jgi:hypothetical protein
MTPQIWYVLIWALSHWCETSLVCGNGTLDHEWEISMIVKFGLWGAHHSGASEQVGEQEQNCSRLCRPANWMAICYNTAVRCRSISLCMQSYLQSSACSKCEVKCKGLSTHWASVSCTELLCAFKWSLDNERVLAMSTRRQWRQWEVDKGMCMFCYSKLSSLMMHHTSQYIHRASEDSH